MVKFYTSFKSCSFEFQTFLSFMDIVLKKKKKYTTYPFLLHKEAQFNLFEHQLVFASEYTGY